MTVRGSAEPDPTFVTSAGVVVPPVLGADDAKRDDDAIGRPGEYPYTRGINASMYREKPWVIGMYSGYSSPKETNARIKSLLTAGQRGFSVALDLPTQVGLDSDDPLARGEVGRVGVPIDTLADMEHLLDGISFAEVEQVRTTANSIGPIAVALFVVASEKQGVRPDSFRLLLQNDSLKEYVARGTYIFPPEPAMKFSVDVIEYCAKHVPNWEPIEFCGYHIRDSGSTAVQEVGVALSNARGYLDEARSRGVDMASVAPHLYLFLSAGLDIFEEAAKFRAARRIWARMLHEDYEVPVESCAVRIFSYTLGSALQAHEPRNNVVRVAYEALSAVLGGAQTLATSSFDEALGLPSDEAVHAALRTQQILAYETGVRRTVDPLGGSYYVEWLTDQIEQRVDEYMARVASQGGCLAVLESGWLERDLSDVAYRLQCDIENGTRPVVGVNLFRRDDDSEGENVKAFALRESAADEQVASLRRIRETRDNGAVRSALAGLQEGAKRGDNAIPYLLDAVRAYASIGEMCGALKEVWGEAERRWQI
jgi:methylmalonyl-CoA mutase N-terminal domain/subunit